MDFSEIKSSADLERISKGGRWQNFEQLAAFIFEENGFKTKVNVVKMFGKKRRQYDVLAEKGNKLYAVDCKRWSGSRYRLSAIKTAVKKHKERCIRLEGAAIPLIVTLIEEEIQTYKDVPIVPMQKLNAFLQEE